MSAFSLMREALRKIDAECVAAHPAVAGTVSVAAIQRITRAALLLADQATEQDKSGAASDHAQASGGVLEGGPWRCFQCDELLTTRAAAEEHFGRYEDCTPACKIGVELFRKMEVELLDWRAENDAASKEFYRLGAAHSVALRREEERGYERGLRDGRAC